MNSLTTLDILAAIGSAVTPLLVLLLTGVGWVLKNRIQRAFEREAELRTDRLQVYNDILEPFILVLTKDEAFQDTERFAGKSKSEVVLEKMVSIEYRQAAFKLALFASDDVLRAYNDLMQFFYQLADEHSAEKHPKKMLEKLGEFLRQIRVSVGNKETQLDSLEMLEWLVTDIKQYRD